MKIVLNIVVNESNAKHVADWIVKDQQTKTTGSEEKKKEAEKYLVEDAIIE